jgi:aspartate/methionine/tyrosine aminotransferase
VSSRVDPGLARPLLRRLDRVGSRVGEDVTHHDLLPLRGSPVKPLPDHIREVVMRALDEPVRRPSRGLLELREAIGACLQDETNVAIDPDRDILVTDGAMQALNIACRTLLSPGDRVLVPTPNFYMDGIVRLAGGEPLYVPLREETDWRWDLDAIEEAARSGIRMFFACNPTNPTGFLPRRADLRAVLDLAGRYGFVVLCDESYDRYVYDGARLTSIFSLRDHSDRWVLARSLSKSHALADWRVGYLAGPASIIDACTTVLEWEMLHCAYVPQRVATAALTGPQDWIGDLAAEYQRRRDAVYSAVEESPWLSCRRPEAAAFLFLNTGRIDASWGEPADLLLAHSVPTVPGKYFQAPGYLRLPFGGDDATIDHLCRILRDFEPSA